MNAPGAVKHDWRPQSACLGLNAEIFMDTTGPKLRTDWSVAGAICAACLVAQECLAEGIEESDVWTFRAGTTPLERLDHIAPDYDPPSAGPAHARRLRRRLLDRMRNRSDMLIAERYAGDSDAVTGGVQSLIAARYAS